ncbi:DoxX family protein [Nesterenkonia natronophila]|uniref:DoxX family protein n=1 Tax=Nesterenkonia natronophila TaxID=2174932 RepID=A0A3A4F987_9MICC|nr:DoxX family protein [Nesterenkonia natronophila]RJN33060.1 DoxX family protein [Nesterenkonia natronophila]
MTLIRKIARPLLGATFIYDGVEKLRNPDEAAEELSPALNDISGFVSQAEQVAAKPRLTAQVLGGVEVAAGVALAVGKFPRIAALALCGAHKLNSYAEFRSADLQSPGDEVAQRKTLLKNISILGGLGFALVDLNGKPSLAWRAEHISKRAKKQGTRFGDNTRKWAEDLGDDASKTLSTWEKDAKKSFKKAEKQARKAVRSATAEAKKAKDKVA